MDILAWFATLQPDQIGLAALVTLTIVSILRGWIIPRSVLTDRMADKDAQIALLVTERDDWKSAFQKKAEEAAELLRQNSNLIAGADTTNRLIESLRETIERGRPRQIEATP